MDKALYEAPQGLDQLGAAEEPIEIEIEDPESVSIRAGDVEIEIEPEEDDDEFSKNLAEDIPDDILASLASELIGDFESDVSARKDWVQLLNAANQVVTFEVVPINLTCFKLQQFCHVPEKVVLLLTFSGGWVFKE